MPDQLAEWGATWQHHHPEWEHRLWTEDTLPPLVNQDIYDRAEAIAPDNVGQLRADVARYELLATYGGVYVDCDFECRRPLDELARLDAFAAWEAPGRWINNAILGARPAHPLFIELIERLPLNVKRHHGRRPNVLTGPQFLTPVARKHKITVLPKAMFYPYTWAELDRAGEPFPQAWAVHHWWNRRRRV
jgi:mannosyltransferase OCH1-like enzyme